MNRSGRCYHLNGSCLCLSSPTTPLPFGAACISLVLTLSAPANLAVHCWSCTPCLGALSGYGSPLISHVQQPGTPGEDAASLPLTSVELLTSYSGTFALSVCSTRLLSVQGDDAPATQADNAVSTSFLPCPASVPTALIISCFWGTQRHLASSQ